jgi:threonine dehydratase
LLFNDEEEKMSEITVADIETAAQRLKDHVNHTPMATSSTLNEQAGAEIFLKCENLQRAGAFKFRGAFNLMSQLSEAQRKRGVVAFSSGNHAQAVALAGKRLGIPAVIVMPHDSPAVKLAATRGYGAEVVLYDRLKDDREKIAKEMAEERGLTLAPPFDHPDIIAGQGTVALEMLADVPDLDALIAPIGGGGLVSGCGIAAHATRPRIRIFGVEPETANDTYLSLRKGAIVSTPLSSSMADGLLTPAPGKLTFPLMRQHLESVLLVSENEIAEALRFLLIRMKLLVEPSGAVPVAALLAGKIPDVAGKKVGVVLSGGNIDPVKLAGILELNTL